MSTNTIIMIAFAIILVIMLVVFVIAKKQEKRPTNYKALFIIGITFMPLGISTKNYAFSGIGALFMIIGLANRKKWEKKKSWDELSYLEKRTKISLLVIAFLIAVFLIMLIFI